MSSTEELVSELNRLDPHLASRLALQSIELFERSRGNMTGDGDSEAMPPDVRLVRKAMLDMIERSQCCPSEIISALGTLRDPDLIPWFRRCLAWQMADQNAGGIYAAMSALEELGENVFAGRASRSIRDWELNRNLAEDYLKQCPKANRGLSEDRPLDKR